MSNYPIEAGSDALVEQRQPPESVFEMLYGRSRGDGIIAVGARRPNTKGDVGVRFFLPLRVTNWQPLLPGILSFKPEWTKYLCANLYDRRALLGREPEEFHERLKSSDGAKPYYFRAKMGMLKELCAIWVDVDVHKNPHGLTNEVAFSILLTRVLQGMLPRPSLMAYSGRGSYFLWLLRETDSIEPPLATQENAHLWHQVIHETWKRCEDIEADVKALAINKWLKAPGTIDTNTGNEVIYLTVGVGSPTNVPLYSLPQLVELYGLLPALQEVPQPVALPPIPTERKKKRKGPGTPHGGNPAAPYRARFMDMERLAQHRGGIPEGHRSVRLLHYFLAVRAALRMTLDHEAAHAQARERTIRFSEKYCKPPLPRSEVTKCTPFRRNKYESRIDTLLRLWHVTRDEAEELALTALLPPALKAEREAERKERTREQTARRKQIDAMIRAGKTNAQIYKIIPPQFRYTVCRRRKAIGVGHAPTQARLPMEH